MPESVYRNWKKHYICASPTYPISDQIWQYTTEWKVKQKWRHNKLVKNTWKLIGNNSVQTVLLPNSKHNSTLSAVR